jgi:hypothetical protein
MKTLKINFVDFWGNFIKNDNYFYHLLSTKYKVVIDESDPDLLFFSVDYGKEKQRDKFKNHRCKKIFFTGENAAPNFSIEDSVETKRYSLGKCDFSFSFQYLDDSRNFRLPLWVLFINWFNVKHSDVRDQSYLIPLKNILTREFSKKTKFCNFVFSNNQGRRLEILNAIQKYKHVDCCGRLANNSNISIQGRGDQKYKIHFLRDYKFTIAAENSKGNGYTTEKIIHPFSVGSIPIYWGAERVEKDFNKDAFINVDNFSSLEELANFIEKIDNDKELYERMISSPIFIDNQIPKQFLPETVLSWMENNILC